MLGPESAATTLEAARVVGVGIATTSLRYPGSNSVAPRARPPSAWDIFGTK